MINQKIFNILLLLCILILIKYISPNNDSILYILQKYLNFIIFKIKNFFNNENETFLSISNSKNSSLENNIESSLENSNKNNPFIINSHKDKYIYNNLTEFKGKTFNGLKNFNDKAPTIISPHQKYFIEKMINKNKQLSYTILKKLYFFIESLVSIDTDYYFLTTSNYKKLYFNINELNNIRNSLLNKLNSKFFKFENLIFNEEIFYYKNVSGKEVNPFSFTVDCDNNIGKLIINIEIDIRNDIVRDYNYLVIKKIRLFINDNNINYNLPNIPNINLLNNPNILNKTEDNSKINKDSLFFYEPNNNIYLNGLNVVQEDNNSLYHNFNYNNLIDNSVTNSSNIPVTNSSNTPVTNSSNTPLTNSSDKQLTNSSDIPVTNSSDKSISSNNIDLLYSMSNSTNLNSSESYSIQMPMLNFNREFLSNPTDKRFCY